MELRLVSITRSNFSGLSNMLQSDVGLLDAVAAVPPTRGRETNPSEVDRSSDAVARSCFIFVIDCWECLC